ncbi:ankyrin repeat and SOCS box protein 13 isoform X1 [Balaenoptera acutorostrata]|uniref:Ankyrin repeat and SOCS box protein 13 isoform X1 n=1 Tax=Balaenoptera acutorostrata TaxID=9767 RepID=A0ABM3TAZ7_BALAC|nr:ankyrin repeat and SOCS box protein 13 isoform X1 [Balaenoptera acutorostrata]
METRAADGSFLGDLGFWVERTPVHEAAQRGETRQLQQLIESGACVNQVMVDSITPLHAASLQGQAQCVQLLLAAGAQVDARNIDGSTPLCDACASGSIECVKLLLSHGAKVNPPLYTASPLHEACMSGSSECVRLLIDVGANLEAHDCHFGTPLHVACAREHLDCVKMLLNAGANVNAAKLHETALHHAAKVKNVDLIEMLIQFGGNIYARDNRGRKPSDYTWSSSASAKCLEHYEKTPLSLSQLCRLSLFTDLPRRDRQERLSQEHKGAQRGWGSRALMLIPHAREAPSLIPSAPGGPGCSKGGPVLKRGGPLGGGS